MASSELSLRQVENAEQALWDLFESVPFGNSAFQTQQFVANHVLPGRSRRQVLLELSEKAKALHHAGAERDRAQIKIRQKRREEESLRTKTAPSEEDRDQLELLAIDVRELEFDKMSQEKLVRDALTEVEALLAVLQSLPAMTREEFEKEEPDYWRDRLLLEARQSFVGTGVIPQGHLEALHQLGILPEAAVLRIKADAEANRVLVEEAQKQLPA